LNVSFAAIPLFQGRVKARYLSREELITAASHSKSLEEAPLFWEEFFNHERYIRRFLNIIIGHRRMAKQLVRLEQKSCKNPKKISLDEIRKSLGENTACYVLITCSAPSEDGKMDVQMFYEGDEVLASYLVDNAQQVFEGQSRSEKSH
jgi:hypothetical protein